MNDKISDSPSPNSNRSQTDLNPDDVEKKRNPKWTRDELILALDLYLQYRDKPLAKDAPQIVELSAVLNQLGKNLGLSSSNSFRNTNGVYMKLMNFRRFDPHYIADGKKGLARGNQDEAVVWKLFADVPDRLREVAGFIRGGVDEVLVADDVVRPDDFSIVEAEEGKLATKVHRYRERDRRLVDAAKRQALKQFGKLSCCVCGFDFSTCYGAAGQDIIDVHHTKPVHTMLAGEKTKVFDLVLVCSNCHRVIHSRREWFSIDQMKALTRKL